jgi:TRAP-type uncharacterized transport system substrate-binding protein
LPDDLVFMTLRGLDDQRKQIESLFQPGQGLTGTLDLRNMWQDVDLPLHPGAERYYKSKGYM